mgnify:CR=1 FL=1
MDKINLTGSKYLSYKNNQDKIQAIKQYVINKTGIEPDSIKMSNSKVIIKTKNQYEAIEIRMKLSDYLSENNIKVI